MPCAAMAHSPKFLDYQSHVNRLQIRHPWIHQCVLYATGMNQLVIIHLPSVPSNQNNQPFVWHDVDILPYFPKGFCNLKLKTMPGTTFPLKHKYQIFYSFNSISSLPNTCLAKQFDCHWMGRSISGHKYR